MKRYYFYIFSLLLVLFLCLFTLWHILYDMNYTHGIYELNISALNIYNDSVGNEWEQLYTVHGVKISDGQTFSVNLIDKKIPEL